ncbi:hypothetical protein RIF29_18173 [Crotalaria pallida]|uniref:Uncharacterized protein n=1 Tax=Crotalaria pallida TaxID=3830 RepID=A0AAN9FJX2_CROPI
MESLLAESKNYHFNFINNNNNNRNYYFFLLTPFFLSFFLPSFLLIGDCRNLLFTAATILSNLTFPSHSYFFFQVLNFSLSNKLFTFQIGFCVSLFFRSLTSLLNFFFNSQVHVAIWVFFNYSLSAQIPEI